MGSFFCNLPILQPSQSDFSLLFRFFIATHLKVAYDRGVEEVYSVQTGRTMSSKRESIAQFLKMRRDESPYLIDRWIPALETQYNVIPGSAEDEPSDDGQKVWTDGEQTWCHHRWPHKAQSSPYYRDSPLTFSPGIHLDRVGSTWWNWEKEESWAVGFDIDVEGAGHKQGISQEKFHEVIGILKGVPYLTLIMSTSGTGAHGYVFFQEDHRPHTKNHNEHTLVAHAVVDKICKDADFDFIGQKIIDVTGVILWFWAQSSDATHPGFTLIQEAQYNLKESDIPDWHISAKKRYYNTPVKKVSGYTETGNYVEESTTEYEVCQLDDSHREILKELEALDWTFIWNSDYNMAHTHTCALKELFHKRATEGRPIKGIFDTISQGTDKSKPNCFLSPRPDGVFRVARFGNNTNEHPSWSFHDGKTWVYYNQEPDVLSIITKFAFESRGNVLKFKPNDLKTAMAALGAKVESIDLIEDHINVLITDSGVLLASIAGIKGELPGWKRRGKNLVCELPVVHKEVVFARNQLEEADKLVRHLRTPNLEQFGWVAKTSDGSWTHYTAYNNVGCVLKERFAKGTDKVRSSVTTNPWTIVHRPFQSEYPEPTDEDKRKGLLRLWNWKAPQLTYPPADEVGPCPHFDMILDHLGRSLNEEVVRTEWCNRWGMMSGADYLRFWIASIIKHPDQPLPYLFFCGPQNSGKSIFFEMFYLLFTSGITSAEQALKGDFNAELASSVIAYIDEKNLNQESAAEMYSRLKEWITARQIPIHKKGFTPYNQTNTLHFVHCANSSLSVPIEDGDTRITVVEVSPLRKIIPKAIMEDYLQKEAPFFLKQVTDITLPSPIDRLRIPMLSSSAKIDLEKMSMTSVEACAAEFLRPCPGARVSVQDFYAQYKEFCGTSNKNTESVISVGRQLKNRSDIYLIGRGRGNQTFIGNVTMKLDETPSTPLVLNDKGRLVKMKG